MKLKKVSNPCHNSRYFPYLFNKTYDLLKIDNTGKFSISCPRDAEFITNVIIKAITKLNLVSHQIVITDATAGVGGNTISFEKHFCKVNAVENDLLRYNYLVNNMKVYNATSTVFFNEDYVSIHLDLEQDVVFLDPPWGGPEYKNQDNIRITLSAVSIETIVNNLIQNKKMAIVVLKLPLNYDYEFFDTCFPTNEKHQNKNMNIVIVPGS